MSVTNHLDWRSTFKRCFMCAVLSVTHSICCCCCCCCCCRRHRRRCCSVHRRVHQNKLK